ncbi:hypothetical protein QTP88_008869 [Uroleucon formosanum]
MKTPAAPNFVGAAHVFPCNTPAEATVDYLLYRPIDCLSSAVIAAQARLAAENQGSGICIIVVVKKDVFDNEAQRCCYRCNVRDCMTPFMSLREQIWTKEASRKLIALLTKVSAVSLPGITTWL